MQEWGQPGNGFEFKGLNLWSAFKIKKRVTVRRQVSHENINYLILLTIFLLFRRQAKKRAQRWALRPAGRHTGVARVPVGGGGDRPALTFRPEQGRHAVDGPRPRRNRRTSADFLENQWLGLKGPSPQINA